jgi:hypothetical protein
MGKACSTRGKPQRRNHVKDLGVDNMKIDLLMEIGCGDVNSIKLCQGAFQWWTLLNTVMNFLFSENREISHQMRSSQLYREVIFCY